MTRVLILNQYYAPDTAVTGRHATTIAERLAAEGHDVTAIVGQPSYAAGGANAAESANEGGVWVERVTIGRYTGRATVARRVAGYLRYLSGAWTRAWRMRPDVIVCFHNPPFLGLVATALARRSGAQLVYVPQDIHPDILVATGWLKLPGFVVGAWDAANRVVFRQASRIIVLGAGMKRTIEAKGVPSDRVEVIPLWAEPALDARGRDERWRREHGISDELVVLYAGNMGIMHPLEPLLSAAAELVDQPVRFVLAGEGVKRPVWEAEVARRHLANVEFLPFQRGEDFARMVAGADLTIVTLTPGMERLAVPSRSFSFLSGGRPIIALMATDADIAELVRSAGAGWAVSVPEDLVSVVAAALRDPVSVRRAGEAARRCYEARFRPSVVTGRYAELISELAGADSPRDRAT